MVKREPEGTLNENLISEMGSATEHKKTKRRKA
jgi:hypothetical protein